MLVFLMLILMIQSRRSLVLVGIIAVAGLFVTTTDSELLRPFTHEREDVSSGRLMVWSTAYGMLQEHSVTLGFGTPQEVTISLGDSNDDKPDEDRELGTHNAFMDASLTYGVPFALVAVAVWFIAFFPGIRRFKDERTRTIYLFQVALFFAVTIKSLVTNTFWTNMGDAVTFFAALVLLCPPEKVAALLEDDESTPQTLASPSLTSVPRYARY
jgi:O-antigen ligase